MNTTREVTPTPFDILDPVPTGTTVLEASAGTGKTWTVGALVTRYVAEGTPLDQLLVVTFGRAASQELRDRVRTQLREAERALADPAGVDPGDVLLAYLVASDVEERRRRIMQALADFDAATIATIHQFCHLVLRSLGVAGDTDSHAELVEDLDDLVVEVTDDLYLRRFGADPDSAFAYDEALAVAQTAVRDPQARLMPDDQPADSLLGRKRDFAEAVRCEVAVRKQRRGVLSYDDLLGRLADALEESDAPARQRMRQHWSVVLVDEFQDTDPVQWKVFDRAFSGHATLVLIGDPKQAIYAFRGGDITTYLQAAETADTQHTLATNWRSDAPLVESLQVLTEGASLGDDRIRVLPVAAHHRGSRLAGAPHPAPVRLRALAAEGQRLNPSSPTIPISAVRGTIAADLAADVAELLASEATYDTRPLCASDVAVLLYSLNDAALFRAALAEQKVASVLTGANSVLLAPAALEWLRLLEALESQRPAQVRALALTSFIGETPRSLDAGGDALTDRLAEQARRWRDLFRSRGLAAVHEAAHAARLGERVLSRPDGERLLTDLDHLGELLHNVARRERLGLPALLEWLRTERRRAERSGVAQRTRRLDTDADAVQVLTYHGSKGLQFPVVYLPMLFNRHYRRDLDLFRDDDGRRCRDLGAGSRSAYSAAIRTEAAAEELRLTYVALTRAQSQVVTWFAPTSDAANSGLSRLLLGRRPGERHVSDRVATGRPDAEIAEILGGWAKEGAFALEAVAEHPPIDSSPRATPGQLSTRVLGRGIDTTWRRTSYSGLIRVEEQAGAGLSAVSEPEVAGTLDEGEVADDEVEAFVAPSTTLSGDLPSPMAAMPAGATFGSLVHGVLEHADPSAPDLLAELRRLVSEQQRWWSVEADGDALAEALLPMQHTSLGPLTGDLTLAEIGLPDRLRELDFEIPLVGGDRPGHAEVVPLRRIADLLRTHLAADDPMLAYAERLDVPLLGDQVLRGYLSGSIDVVLRVPGQKFVVVDYKTNRLGEPDQPLTAADYTHPLVTEAMLHSHYPLQALLYSVVLHRYLRWRLPDYDPESNLGGILYLYVRGMCGPSTPVVDGQPCGVFAWQPPAALIVALSDLLAGSVV